MGLRDAVACGLERGDDVARKHQVERRAQVEALQGGLGRAERVVGQHGQAQPGGRQAVERLPRASASTVPWTMPSRSNWSTTCPQLGGEVRLVGGGDVQPFGDGALARVGGRLVERADFERVRLDDGGADAKEVDSRVDQGVVEVEDDDRAARSASASKRVRAA